MGSNLIETKGIRIWVPDSVVATLTTAAITFGKRSPSAVAADVVESCYQIWKMTMIEEVKKPERFSEPGGAALRLQLPTSLIAELEVTAEEAGMRSAGAVAVEVISQFFKLWEKAETSRMEVINTAMQSFGIPMTMTGAHGSESLTACEVCL